MTTSSTLTANEKHDIGTIREKAGAAKQAVADLTSEVCGCASERYQDIRTRAQEKIKDTSDTVVAYVQNNPYKSVAIAAGAGVLLGLLLKRR